MAKKTYSLDLGGATTGTFSLGGWPGADPDSTAASLRDGILNLLSIGGSAEWQCTGTSPILIHQPESLGNYELAFDPGDLDGSPSFTVVQQWSPSVNAVSVGDNTIGEPSGEAVVAFAIAATHSASVTVEFTVGGTATDGDDFTKSTTSPVVIVSGESTATMSITVVDDAAFESSETVIVSLGSITGGDAGTSSTVTITITSDDAEPAPTMIVYAPTGLTLTAKVFARGSDTLIETVTLTERTNCKGVYEGDVTEDEEGWHHLSIFSGATCIGTADVYLTTEAVEHYSERGIEDPSGLLIAVGPTATDIRGAVGLASANLDTQLNGTATKAAAIMVKTDHLPSVAAGASGGLLIGSVSSTLTISGGSAYAKDHAGANLASQASLATVLSGITDLKATGAASRQLRRSLTTPAQAALSLRLEAKQATRSRPRGST
jgi:hypothetical protein